MSHAYSRATVAVGAAASAIGAISVASSAAKVLTAATIVARGNHGRLSSYRCSRRGCVAASGQASGSAVSIGVSTPSVRRAASALVDCAVGVAKQVAVGRTALSVLGVLVLPLLWDDAKVRRRDLGVVTLDVRNTLAVVAVLSAQTAVGLSNIACRVDPVKVNVG